MTGSYHRTARACAVALSFSLITGAIAYSAPQHFSSSSRPPLRLAQLEQPAAVHAAPPESQAEDAPTLELVPAETDQPDVTGAMILRVVSELRSDAGVEVAVAGNDRPRSRAVQQALRLRGSRYRYGGTSRGGFDCSGFTRYVYSRMGIALPHSSSAQFHCGRSVRRGEVKPGDLVFFSRGGRHIGHVGIYIGNGRFVHASNPSRGVVVDSMKSSYYARRYKGARRVR